MKDYFSECLHRVGLFVLFYTILALKKIILEFFGNIYLTAQNVQEKHILLQLLLLNVGHCPRDYMIFCHSSLWLSRPLKVVVHFALAFFGIQVHGQAVPSLYLSHRSVQL